MMNRYLPAARIRRRALNAEINVTPFVDVMLVLLIIFMIVATTLPRGIEVNLPRAASGPVSTPRQAPLIITVTANGTVFISKTEIKGDELAAKLAMIGAQGYDQRIFLRGDAEAGYGAVLEIMTQIKQAGFTNIALVTAPRRQETS